VNLPIDSPFISRITVKIRDLIDKKFRFSKKWKSYLFYIRRTPPVYIKKSLKKFLHPFIFFSGKWCMKERVTVSFPWGQYGPLRLAMVKTKMCTLHCFIKHKYIGIHI